MPLLSTFGAAPAKAFGFTSSNKEPPGSWFAPEGADAAESYQPIGYAEVTVTVVGVVGGTGNFSSTRYWNYSAAAYNAQDGNKRGNASQVVRNAVDPTTLKFRTVETSNNATRGFTSGTATNLYSASQANQASQSFYSGQPGGASTAAFSGSNLTDNNVIAAGAGGGAVGRPDRNSSSYPNAYNAITDADESNNNADFTNTNNGGTPAGGACYYSSGGSGGGYRGGTGQTQAANKGGYSGKSYATGGTLTTGVADTTFGENSNTGFGKISWS